MPELRLCDQGLSAAQRATPVIHAAASQGLGRHSMGLAALTAPRRDKGSGDQLAGRYRRFAGPRSSSTERARRSRGRHPAALGGPVRDALDRVPKTGPVESVSPPECAMV